MVWFLGKREREREKIKNKASVALVSKRIFKETFEDEEEEEEEEKVLMF